MNRKAMAGHRDQKEALHKTASESTIGRNWSGHRSAWTGPVTYRRSPKRSNAGWWFLLLAAALFFYVWRLGC